MSTLSFVGHAQDEQPVSIKVRKEQKLSKAYFDNTEMRLSAIDKYGNPRSNKIASFKLWIKGEKKPLLGYDNDMGTEITRELNKLKKATKIYFTEITIEDDDGHLMKLPDLYEVWFPNCVNCEVIKKKKRN